MSRAAISRIGRSMSSPPISPRRSPFPEAVPPPVRCWRMPRASLEWSSRSATERRSSRSSSPISPRPPAGSNESAERGWNSRIATRNLKAFSPPSRTRERETCRSTCGSSGAARSPGLRAVTGTVTSGRRSRPCGRLGIPRWRICTPRAPCSTGCACRPRCRIAPPRSPRRAPSGCSRA
mgnify:CR=1 FL=1